MVFYSIDMSYRYFGSRILEKDYFEPMMGIFWRICMFTYKSILHVSGLLVVGILWEYFGLFFIIFAFSQYFSNCTNLY